MIRGIDVSKWQGQIDWNKVYNDGVEFVVIRATVFGNAYAPEFVDPLFNENYHNAREAGLKVGAYYVHRPDLDEKMQIDHFLDDINGLVTDLPFVFDVELDGYGMSQSAITAHLWRCLELFEQEQDRPMIYTARWFWDSHILADSEWSNYPLWVASYTPQPFMPRDWDDYVIWQHSDKGRVDGIVGNVDLNKMKPSEDDKLIFTLNRDTPIYSGLGLDAKLLGHIESGESVRGKRAWLETKDGWIKIDNNI